MSDRGWAGRVLPSGEYWSRGLLGVLTAVVLLWALASGVGTALAASDTVTTELQPGWNLAGWTEDEASVETLFAAIPQLVVAYAWDADLQRYRLAYRDGETATGDLETLSPGIGLWLFLEGEETVAWERPLVLQAGLAELRRGWNLVTWAGDDGIATGVALAELEGILLETLGGDGSAPQTLEKGRPVWLRISSAKQWWQLTPPPRIEFRGDFTPAQMRERRAYVDDVVAFFVRRHGVAVPGLTVLFGDEEADMTCGGYAARTLFIRNPCITALPHEYSHAVQHHLAVRDAEGNWGGGRGEERIGPSWLSEGIANYAAAVYEDLIGIGSLEQWNADALDVGLANSNSLEAIETNMGVGGDAGANYHLASLVTGWIVENQGEAALYDFYDVRNEVFRWRSAFHEAFGMPIDQFYKRFEDHRASLAAQRPQVAGKVIGPGGEGQAGVRVEALPQGEGKAWRMNTDDTGAFSGVALEGTYRLSLFLGDTPCHLGWYGGEGYTTSRVAITVLDLPEDARTGIVIQLPRPASELCTTIRGALVDVEGNPYTEPPWVVAWPLHDQDGYTGKDGDGSGMFALDVRTGATFELSLHSYYVRECVVSPHPSLVPDPGAKARVSVGEQDATGIVITVTTGPRRIKEAVGCTAAR